MNKKTTKERRGCTYTRPLIYFLLEMIAIIIIASIASGGPISGNIGFIIIVVGLGYSFLKLPKFINRVSRCKEQERLRQKKLQEERELDAMGQWT
jgi:hypothetical protein